MKHIPLIRANILNGFIAYLEEIAAPTQQLLTQAKLPASALHDPESLLPLKQVFEFYERSARSTGCEHFGLMVGQRIQLPDLGAFGRLIYQSFTLHEAIHTGIYMLATYNSGERIWLLEQNDQSDQVWLGRNVIDNIRIGRQQAEHCALMIMLNVIQLAANSEWRPAEIHLETGQTKELHKIEVLSDTKILFNQKATAIVFPRSFLSLPLRHTDNPQPEQRCKDYEILYTSAPATSFAGSVRQIATALLKDGYPDIRVIADMVGMSVRTFQRQLS
ncbi:MAG TPA: AraC family transcriptional regulator ligand-binding domain-containing protein, partial [Allocoleopsis sp.]